MNFGPNPPFCDKGYCDLPQIENLVTNFAINQDWRNWEIEKKCSWLASAPASGRSVVLFHRCQFLTKSPPSHVRLPPTTCRCLIPRPQPIAVFSAVIINQPPASSSPARRLIVNEGENNISELRHSVPSHSCGPLSSQIQSCRRPLALPSAIMSGCLGKAQHCTLG